MIYLIHFDRPLGNLENVRGTARHYLGYARNIDDRVERHRDGQGSFLMKAVVAAKIGWSVVRTWPGDRAAEKQLKRLHNSRKLCPVCRGFALEQDEQ